MRKAAFKQWLEQKEQGYGAVGNYPSQCERVDEQLGDLDAAYQQDGLEGILSQLVPENTAFPMTGDRQRGMDSLRTAIRSYKRFCDACPPESLPEADTADRPPMLTSVTIRNFKSYKEATLPLGPLTLLIGANASGKSNAVEALRLLYWGFFHPMLDVWKTTIDGIRGQKGKLFYDDTQNIQLNYVVDGKESELSFYPPDDARERHITVTKKDIFLDKERIQNQLRLLNISPQDFDADLFFTLAKSLGAQKDLIAHIQFLDTIPARMRDYADRQNDALQADAANLSAVLYRLCQDTARRERLLSFAKSLPEQDIVDIRFVETPRDEVMVQLVESFGDKERTMDADSLSDGTLRVLALAAFLLTAPAGSLLVVEELDNGIHPSRARDLVAQTLDIARQRQVQILLTSHNPALLDALPYDALPDVVCCYRDRTEGDSRLVRLGDLPKYPALMAQGSLGDLVTRQVIDRYLHDTRTAEEEKAAALSWLEELRAATEQDHA